MNVQIFLVTDYIIPQDAAGKHLPKTVEATIVSAIKQANAKLFAQGMESAKVRTNPVLNDGNKDYLRRIWKFNRIETPMLVFVDFAYGDNESYNVLSTLYGSDMNAAKIYETLEYFALLVRLNGKYIRPDGSEWKPLSNDPTGSDKGNGDKDQKGAKDGERNRIPFVDSAVEFIVRVLGKPALYLAAALSAKQALDANNQTAKIAYGSLSAYLVYRANQPEEKK